MKFITLISIIISLVVGVLAFLGSNNYIIGIVIGVIFLLYYFLIARKRINKYQREITQSHECYHFINSFIVTLSVKESLIDAFDNATKNAKNELANKLNDISEMDVSEKMVYLRGYFNLSLYKIFLDLIALYQDQGGDILAMSTSLQRESLRNEETINNLSSISKKKLGEFISLWGLTLVVLLFVRFGLKDFYGSMLSSKPFVFILCGFFLVLLASIHLFLTSFTKIKLKKDTL